VMVDLQRPGPGHDSVQPSPIGQTDRRIATFSFATTRRPHGPRAMATAASPEFLTARLDGRLVAMSRRLLPLWKQLRQAG
jgi:hypothetical protein